MVQTHYPKVPGEPRASRSLNQTCEEGLTDWETEAQQSGASGERSVDAEALFLKIKGSQGLVNPFGGAGCKQAGSEGSL